MSPRTGGIFLSYRREDTQHMAGRLADRLVDQFGAEEVFMDVDSIEPGMDFAEAIEHAVSRSKVLIVLIGTNWVNAIDEQGNRRIDDPNDFVALEVKAALQRGIRVIPVLADGARPPSRDELPSALQLLARRNAIRVDHESFRSDVTQLISTVRSLLLVPDETATVAADDEKREPAQLIEEPLKDDPAQLTPVGADREPAPDHERWQNRVARQEWSAQLLDKGEKEWTVLVSLTFEDHTIKKTQTEPLLLRDHLFLDGREFGSNGLPRNWDATVSLTDGPYRRMLQVSVYNWRNRVEISVDTHRLLVFKWR
jgi:TIR domain-containing protein